MAGVCVFGIISSKPSHYCEPGQIILLEIDQSLEVRSHFSVLLLSVTVSLKVKHNRNSLFDSKKMAKQ